MYFYSNRFSEICIDLKWKELYNERNKLRNGFIIGASIGILYGLIEYLVRLNTNDDLQEFIPLMIRAGASGILIVVTMFIFELRYKNKFNQRHFLFLVITRSFVYTVIITFWLSVVNGIWFAIQYGSSFTILKEELINYYVDDIYLFNLVSVFLVMIFSLGLIQINSLHKKGELLNFVLGKYHTPREVDLIFCFIDLKGSTTIAEKLGHLRFAMFLKDYYADITDALQKTSARIYQYVGDEVVLTWSYKNGLRNNNAINCFFEMKKIINKLKKKYISKYDTVPEFKAGLHGGSVIVTWVGEMKKEIVYIGDVLNTTARIQEDCKRLTKDFLISEDLLIHFKDLANFKTTFLEESILRGKEKALKLYSIEQVL